MQEETVFREAFDYILIKSQKLLSTLCTYEKLGKYICGQCFTTSKLCSHHCKLDGIYESAKWEKRINKSEPRFRDNWSKNILGMYAFQIISSSDYHLVFVVQSTQEIDLFEKIISSLTHSFYAFKLKLEYQIIFNKNLIKSQRL